MSIYYNCNKFSSSAVPLGSQGEEVSPTPKKLRLQVLIFLVRIYSKKYWIIKINYNFSIMFFPLPVPIVEFYSYTKMNTYHLSRWWIILTEYHLTGPKWKYLNEMP